MPPSDSGETADEHRPEESAPEHNGDTQQRVEPKPTALPGQHGIDAAQVWMSAFLIVVVGVIAYSNLFGVPWHLEDQDRIRNNTALHAFKTFPEALDAKNPRTLTMATLAVNWWLTPDWSAAFHAVNLLFHLANGVLVFLLCRALLGKRAGPVVSMVAGMLFVLHPLNTESVDYIVGRAEILAAFFVLGALLLFVKATKDPAKADAWRLALSVFCFVLAAGCDAPALALPVLVTALDGVRRGRLRPAVVGPYWAVLGVLVATRMATGAAPALATSVLRALPEYLGLMAAARGLSAAHTFAPASGWVTIAVLLAALVATLALLLKRSVAGFALVWLLAALVCGAGSENALTERHAYLAVAGAVLLVPWVLSLLRPAPVRVVAGVACAALVFAAGTATYLRNIVWQDEVALWTDAMDKDPDSAVPPRNLGRVFVSIGQSAPMAELAATAFAEAERRMRVALERGPGDPEALEALAVALGGQNKTDEALSAFLNVLRVDLDNRTCLIHVGDLLSQRAARGGGPDDFLEAIDYYRRADALHPLSRDALARYAVALNALGDFEAAAPVLRRAVGGDDASPLAPLLKQAEAMSQRIAAMRQQTAALLTKDPKDAAALKMQAQLDALGGRVVQASYLLDELLSAGSADFPAWVLMGFCRAKMDAAGRFLEEWPTPPEKPDAPESAWVELARTCAASGLWDAAQTYLESAPAREAGGPAGLVALGEIALQLRQPRRAQDYLERAAQARPEDPAPWLRLCDLAVALKDLRSAAQHLEQAKQRGASDADLAPRRERLGETPPEAEAPVRKIIR